MKLLRTLALAAFLPTVALAGAPMMTSQMVDGQGNPIGTLASPFKASDPANAAFSTATVMTAGTAYAAGRSVGVNCTVSGTITLTLGGGGTINLPISPGWQTFPFAATQFAFPDAGAGAVYNLN